MTPCPECGFVHTSTDTLAVGRFDPDGPRGYRARSGGPLRETRAEAERDECQSRQNRVPPPVASMRPVAAPQRHAPISEPGPFPTALMETAARAKAWRDFLAQTQFSLMVWKIDPSVRGECEHVLTWLRHCRDELAGLVTVEAAA